MKSFKLKPICKLAIASSLGLGALALPTAVYADEDTGFTLSAAYGGYKSRGGEFDDDNDLYEVSVGYRFLPFLGIEAGYTDMGKFGGDIASADVDGYSASLVGTLPVSKSFNLYAEVGQFFSKTRIEALGFEDSMDDKTLFYGVGASFKIAEPLWMTLEYQRYKVDVNDDNWPVELSDEDTDIDAVKVGALFKF